MQQAVTRELKLALIVGVTLVLGVAVLVSDHLATKRRPTLDTAVAVQPAMTPLPAPIRAPEPMVEPVLAPVEPVVAQRAPEVTVTEIAITTPGVSGPAGMGPDVPAPKQVEPQPRQVGPKPLLLSKQTSPDEPGVAEPKAVRTYTVVDGDSAYKLARKFLGDGGKWKQIVDANPKVFGAQGQLQIGATLVIPGEPARAVLPVREPPALAKAPEAKAETKSDPKKSESKVAMETGKRSKTTGKAYTVKPGDTLSGIARRELGSSGRAMEIADMNKSVIKDPDTLPLGVSIRLPEG